MNRKVTFALTFLCVFTVAAGAAYAGAGITGTVKLQGDPPKAKSMTITKDEKVCGEGQRAVDEVTVTGDGMLSDVVVFIEGKIDGVSAPEPPDGGYKLIQRGCRFVPFVSYVPKKQEFTILNDDPLAHNIHAYEIIGRARRDLLNFAQPEKGHTKVQKMTPRRGNIIQLTCDIHDFMSGWIFVPDNPFAATVTEGQFSIEGVPAGTYTLKAYHPVFGFVEQQVELADGKTLQVDFLFDAAQRLKR